MAGEVIKLHMGIHEALKVAYRNQFGIHGPGKAQNQNKQKHSGGTVHLKVGPVHLALQAGNRFETNEGLATVLILDLSNTMLDRIVTAAVAKIFDLVENPGGAVIILLQPILDELQIRP
jgi:hypothetical protein